MTQKQLTEMYAKGLVGKTAQSRILTMIGDNGEMVHEPAQEITAYEMVKWLGEDVAMLKLGGVMVFEDTLFNIS